MLLSWQTELIEKLTATEHLPTSVLAVEREPGGEWECWVVKTWQAPTEHVPLLTIAGYQLASTLLATVEHVRLGTSAGVDALASALLSLPLRRRQYSPHHRFVLYEYVAQPAR